MNLAEALSSEFKTNYGPKCSTCVLIAGLDKDDAAALEAAFADGNFTSAAIGRALRAQGHSIHAAALMRHRKGECSK